MCAKFQSRKTLGARHVREIIEVSIVREVALNHDAALIKALRKIITQQQNIKSGDRKGFLTLDDDLHKMLALHAGREYAWRVTENIKSQIDRVRF